jgi:general stress protein 26
MPESSHDSDYVHLLLAGAEKAIAGVPYCWLSSQTEVGIRSRPMGRILGSRSEDVWTILFLADLRSRKVAEIRHSDSVTLTFQKDDEEAYISFIGRARLIEREQDVQALWIKDAYGRHFPTAEERSNAGFIEVRITRMELWIRGLTPEPFGIRPTILIRTSDRSWRCTD